MRCRMSSALLRMRLTPAKRPHNGARGAPDRAQRGGTGGERCRHAGPSITALWKSMRPEGRACDGSPCKSDESW